MKSTKKTLLLSTISLVVCIAMLVGTTFAWFTDVVTSSKNIITSGNVDLEMYWTDDLDSGVWHNVENKKYNTIFSYDNWEPGYTEVKYIKLVNAGSLALNYKLAITPTGDVGKLAEVINVFYAQDGVKVQSRDQLDKLGCIGLLNNVMDGRRVAQGTLLADDQYNPNHDAGETIITLAMNMITTAGNEYQSQSIGDGFTITALATQCPYEKDSFGSDYDSAAKYPAIIKPGKYSETVEPVDGKVPAGGLQIVGESYTATVPAGVALKDNVSQLDFSVTPLKNTSTDITVVNNEILIPVDVHIDGVAENNTVPIIVDLGEVLPKYLNMGNYRLFHVEDGQNMEMTLVDDRADLTAHNTFTYDPVTGEVSVAMATFSEVALVADTEAKWNGSVDYTWYNAEASELTIANADQLYAFAKIVGGMADGIKRDSFENKTVELLSDIKLATGHAIVDGNTKVFYPIGYYNNATDSNNNKVYDRDDAEVVGMADVYSNVSSFSGTFDGKGHTISNFYQNTWEMFGDYNNGYSGTPNYYKDAMGLFGYVNGGTIKNLTVDSFTSDGEFTPTGVIAAYADGDAKFENLAITNCTPRVYNTGNGGIIGIAGDTSAANDDHITLKNVTVDNTNKITALWGSYDVACGGLVGMYRGNVSGNGNATGDTISFNNCRVAAQMDVYNDVCGNYQYYAYRYAGMIIGSIRHNTTNDDGKTIPNMKGISASDCTVNYGDWNDYYYCEYEKNSQASYTEDYQFSRVDKSEIIFDEKGKAIGCTHKHTDKEDKRAVYLPFHQLFTGYSWGVSSIGLEKYGGIVTNLDITESDKNETGDKFVSKFDGDFLYRVGNKNEVTIGTLFEVMDGKEVYNNGVYVTIDKVDENADVSGTFTANTTDWEKGTIQFSGTGVVKVIIQDYDFCMPTVLLLEVVDAVNATSATSAKSNNVVLLNDCGFSSLEVSGGYTLFGNGFTMTCGSDSAALDMGYSFVTLNNGTLDNVQIVTPNFDHAVLYKSNMTESGNRSETTDRTRYFNVKSGVMVSGNSQILNSRISGGRAALNVSGGNVVVDNSRIELGAVASILVGSANSLTLRDVTLVQKPTASTYDSSKTLMGFSVLYMCDSEGKAASTTLEGTLVQQAWVNADDKKYVPSAAQDIVDGIMKETAFIHNINGKDSLNLGFAYMPEDAQKTVAAPDNITDNRTDKATIPYEMKAVKIQIAILSTTVYVYSYKNTNGTADSFKTESEYKPNKYSDIITVTYSDTADGLATGKSFGTDGWVYELNVDLDKLSGYTLDFSKLAMTVNGTNVTDFKVNGNAKPASPVAVTAGGTTYSLTATVNGKEYTATYKVTGTETSKESPSLVASNYEAGLCVASSYGGTWHGAAPALEGIQIKYWSVAEKQYKTINLSDYTPTTKGQLNGTNTTWTYSPANGDFTLTLTGGQVHSSNKVSAMPVVCDGKLYFVAAKSNGLVNSGNSARTIPVSYTFKDNNNGDVLTFSHTWSVAENKDEQYKYSDFCNGTLTKLKASSGGGCVTPDTLVTLADGTQVRVDSLKGDEELLVWNHETGKLEKAPVAYIVNHDGVISEREIIHLNFANGKTVKMIGEHVFFDATLNKYVAITSENANDFIGHTFVALAADGMSVEKVALESLEREIAETGVYEVVSYKHLTCFTEGILSTSAYLDPLLNIFDVSSETLAYDMESVMKDVEEYGLYTYDDFDGLISEEAFELYNAKYLKIAVGKGYIDWNDILGLIDIYFNVDVNPIQ